MMKLFRVTCCLLVLLLSLVAFAFVAVHPARAQTLNPPPPSFYTCKTVGNGTICMGDRIVDHGLTGTGIICGTGPNAFEILDNSALHQYATRYYDQDGNLTRRVIHEVYIFGETINSVTGATVPYTQHDTLTDVLAVPGDLSTATETVTGENIFTDPHIGQVIHNAGRFVTAPDGTIEFEAGRNDFLDNFAAANQRMCEALS